MSRYLPLNYPTHKKTHGIQYMRDYTICNQKQIDNGSERRGAMQTRSYFSRLIALFIALSVMSAFMPVISGEVYAADNATGYEAKQGPHDDGAIYVNDFKGEHFDVFQYGVVFTTPEGTSYDPASNTLTLENFIHPEYEFFISEMGDDFTIKVIGECEIGQIETTGWEHEGMGEKGEPLYWGCSLNITGPGRLTVSNTIGSETDPYGIMMVGDGSDSTLSISKHTSLKVLGFGSEPAIMMWRSASFYDNKVFIVDGRNITSVYPKYAVKGFMNEGEATLKDYWIDSSEVIIDGDGITEIDDKPVILAEQYLEYTGSEVKPVILTIDGMKLAEGTDYTVTYSPSKTVNAGKYKALITGKGKYSGKTKAAFEIFPASGATKAKAAAKTLKIQYKKLKKSSQYIKASKYVSAGKNQGTLKYKIVSAKKGKKSYKKYFSIKSGSGKLTIKKKLKKGTYTVKVRVTASGSKNYKVTKSATVTFKVRVR